MNHHVPDFELDDVYSVPGSSGLTRKSSMADDEVMELLWQNGHLVTQSQNQRSSRRNSDSVEAGPPRTASTEIQSAVEEVAVHQDHLFMQEDEMASWLHYPFQETTFERDISDYFNPPPPTATASNATISVSPPPPMVEVSEEVKVSTSRELNVQPGNELASLPVVLPTPPTRPPVPPSSKQKEVVIEAPKPRRRLHNFAHFTKLRIESGPSSSGKSAKESTAVASHNTPKVSEPECGRISLHEGRGASNLARDLTTTTMNTYDFATTSSPGGDSSASMSAGGELPRMPSGNQEERKEDAVGEDRKRKSREVDDNEGHSLDNEFEFGGEKKQARGSTSTKRSRAAEVHNLSERRRRDRINEKMKTLQELIPRCNKTDKASMLDEAIEYLKSLQLQVQMMSMGCGMVPIMYPGVHQYPGVQQYMPAMGMGMRMGAGMGMDMSMNRPLVPYPQMVQGSSMNPAAGAHMAPRFPMQAFHMPVVHDPSRMQPPNAGDPMMNPMAAHNPNFANPYQQYLGPQQGQGFIPQNQTAAQQTNAKPSSSREDENPENRQPGK